MQQEWPRVVGSVPLVTCAECEIVTLELGGGVRGGKWGVRSEGVLL